MDTLIRELVNNNASTMEIREQARLSGGHPQPPRGRRAEDPRRHDHGRRDPARRRRRGVRGRRGRGRLSPTPTLTPTEPPAVRCKRSFQRAVTNVPVRLGDPIPCPFSAMTSIGSSTRWSRRVRPTCTSRSAGRPACASRADSEGRQAPAADRRGGAAPHRRDHPAREEGGVPGGRQQRLRRGRTARRPAFAYRHLHAAPEHRRSSVARFPTKLLTFEQIGLLRAGASAAARPPARPAARSPGRPARARRPRSRR